MNDHLLVVHTVQSSRFVAKIRLVKLPVSCCHGYSKDHRRISPAGSHPCIQRLDRFVFLLQHDSAVTRMVFDAVYHKIRLDRIPATRGSQRLRDFTLIPPALPRVLYTYNVLRRFLEDHAVPVRCVQCVRISLRPSAPVLG